MEKIFEKENLLYKKSKVEHYLMTEPLDYDISNQVIPKYRVGLRDKS